MKTFCTWLAYVLVFQVIVFSASIIVEHRTPRVTVIQQTAAQVQANPDYETAMQSQIAQISALRNCVSPDQWNHHELPFGMILQKVDTYSVTLADWTYPAPAGYWTVALCKVGR